MSLCCVKCLINRYLMKRQNQIGFVPVSIYEKLGNNSVSFPISLNFKLTWSLVGWTMNFKYKSVFSLATVSYHNVLYIF